MVTGGTNLVIFVTKDTTAQWAVFVRRSLEAL